jgi:excisionase family DNA binding protein
MASRLWKGEFDKIGINTMEKLCDYFYCQPNDFLEYPLTLSGNTQTSKDVGRATQLSNTELSKPKQKGVLWAGKPPGESWKNSVLDIVQSSSDNELLSTVQVAARLNVSRKSVNDYIISGKIPAVKGKQNHNFIRESDLLAFMARK